MRSPWGSQSSCCSHPYPPPRSIPVTFAAGVRSTHASEERFTAEICVEYVSPEAAGPLVAVDSPVATPGDSNQAVLGRHAVLPVEVHVQPSLQVAAVQFREIYLPAGEGAAGAAANGAAGEAAAGAGAGAAEGAADEAAAEDSEVALAGSGSGSSSATTFERRCVMEVSVANRGRWPLQVGAWGTEAFCSSNAPRLGWGSGGLQAAGLHRAFGLPGDECMPSVGAYKQRRQPAAGTTVAGIPPAAPAVTSAPAFNSLPSSQVWLGRAIPDPAHLAAAAERDLLLPPQLPPAAEGVPASGLLPPGRRCTVAYILDEAACSSGSQAASGVLGAAPGGGGGVPAGRLAASFEEQQRQECAERLCRALALFYRVDADDGGIAGGCKFLCSLGRASQLTICAVLPGRRG